MLAKVAPTSADFQKLATYLVRGTSAEPDPNRVAWVFSQNLPSNDPELAARYMQATAALSKRVRGPVYHLMIAWAERERPSPELMQNVARETLKRAGLAEHQALVMGHGDKPHRHLHIMLNRVHPDTGKAWRTNGDFLLFDRIMRDLSATYGCEYVPGHAFEPELTEEMPKAPATNAHRAALKGAPTSRPQWSTKTAQNVSESVSEDLTHASTPDDVELALRDHGLNLEQKGRGFVVGTPQSYAKLSKLALHMTAMPRALLQRAADTFHVRRRPTRQVFTVDEIDITRAFVNWGVLDADDLRTTIRSVRERRQEQSAARRAELSSSLSLLLPSMIPKHTRSSLPASIPRPR